MLWLYIVIGLILLTAIAILIGSYYCYKRIFFSPPRKKLGPDEYEIPDGEIYEAFKDEMIKWVKNVRNMKHEDFSIKTFDGTTLKGKYYEHKKNAPIELLFHGYRGYGERDLSGGIERCFKLGHNAVIIDQRSCGESEGHIITFGIKERLDCLEWIKFILHKFGNDVEIILTGISMGAATVMMTANDALPPNVKYILADCGYTSPKEIIKKVIKDMKLPANLVYPIVKLGAKIFGHFNLEETSPLQAVKNAKVPVIFIHGDNDDFVPCNMSKQLFEECTSKKQILIIPNAGHGLAYPVQKDEYINSIKIFKNELNKH